jgi:hypothetical protein
MQRALLHRLDRQGCCCFGFWVGSLCSSSLSARLGCFDQVQTANIQHQNLANSSSSSSSSGGDSRSMLRSLLFH